MVGFIDTVRATVWPDLLVKVGPKGYIHGWVFVGAPGIGAIVHHPTHGRGVVSRFDEHGHAHVDFPKGTGRFEHVADHPHTGEPKLIRRPAGRTPKVKPSAPAPAAVASHTVHPAGTPIGDLKRGDYARVTGTDQYGQVTSLEGYVQAPPATFRMGRRGGRKVDVVGVSLTETPSGANGWRGEVYSPPGGLTGELKRTDTDVPGPAPGSAEHHLAEAARHTAAAEGIEQRRRDMQAFPVSPGRGRGAQLWAGAAMDADARAHRRQAAEHRMAVGAVSGGAAPDTPNSGPAARTPRTRVDHAAIADHIDRLEYESDVRAALADDARLKPADLRRVGQAAGIEFPPQMRDRDQLIHHIARSLAAFGGHVQSGDRPGGGDAHSPVQAIVPQATGAVPTRSRAEQAVRSVIDAPTKFDAQWAANRLRDADLDEAGRLAGGLPAGTRPERLNALVHNLHQFPESRADLLAGGRRGALSAEQQVQFDAHRAAERARLHAGVDAELTRGAVPLAAAAGGERLRASDARLLQQAGLLDKPKRGRSPELTDLGHERLANLNGDTAHQALNERVTQARAGLRAAEMAERAPGNGAARQAASDARQVAYRDLHALLRERTQHTRARNTPASADVLAGMSDQDWSDLERDYGRLSGPHQQTLRDRLTEAATHPDAAVRERAAELLGRLPGPAQQHRLSPAQRQGLRAVAAAWAKFHRQQDEGKRGLEISPPDHGATTTATLRSLKDAGLVTTHLDGTSRRYTPTDAGHALLADLADDPRYRELNTRARAARVAVDAAVAEERRIRGEPRNPRDLHGPQRRDLAAQETQRAYHAWEATHADRRQYLLGQMPAVPGREGGFIDQVRAGTRPKGDGRDLTGATAGDLDTMFHELSAAEHPDEARMRAVLDEMDRRHAAPVDTEPLAGRDLRALSGDDLDALWRSHAEHPSAVAAIRAELARRDQVSPQEPTAADRIDALVAKGVSYRDAYADVHDLDREALDRQERAALVRSYQRAGETVDQAVRRMYAEHVHMQHMAAEAASAGHLLTPAARATGVDPVSLFSGPVARARLHASEELKRWWEQHPRITFTQFRADMLGRSRDRVAAARTRGQGAGRDFGI